MGIRTDKAILAIAMRALAEGKFVRGTASWTWIRTWLLLGRMKLISVFVVGKRTQENSGLLIATFFGH